LNDDLTNFGFVVVGVFVTGWLLSILAVPLEGFREYQGLRQ